jgi:heme/copper-type cytochrome/quinol oxidase subunit 2
VSADDEDGGNEKPPGEKPTRLGKFIQTYHTFLSTFVIGVAGLVATSIWQYRQSQIASQQARSEQAIAQTKAENDWRIARAEILSKNLNVLSG